MMLAGGEGSAKEFLGAGADHGGMNEPDSGARNECQR
jgi:hypothetical protein